MKVLLISDTHLGITTKGQLKNCLKKAAQETFDVLIHAGDYSGGTKGHTMVKETVEMIRDVFPDKPYLSVLGNHDHWIRGKKKKSEYPGYPSYARPSGADYAINLHKIKETFAQNRVHFLDCDGLYRHPNHSDVVFMGVSGWYNNPNPPTNDGRFLPIGLEGDTNRYLLNSANKRVYELCDEYAAIRQPGETLVFVSHFPVINAGADYKGSFQDFNWSEGIGNMLKEDFGCKHFLNGHAHKLFTGEQGRYECGSDYYNPKYLIVEV